jgi:hypothetical protein
MAGLANGRAVVTTDGKLTEDVWRTTRCVALTPVDPAALSHTTRELLDDTAERDALQSRAASTYASCFALRHTIAALRADCLRLSTA